MTDDRTAHVAAALVDGWNMIPALAEDMAATALAAYDEWDAIPPEHIAQMWDDTRPLRDALEARDEALDVLVAACDDYGSKIHESADFVVEEADHVAAAHRAVKGDQ